MANTLKELEKLQRENYGDSFNIDVKHLNALSPCCDEDSNLVSVLNRSEMLLDRLIGLANDPDFDFSKLRLNKSTLIELRNETHNSRMLLTYKYHFAPAEWVTVPKSEDK